MSFLGALIGAAGTIFAATIAYVAVQIQLDAAKEQAADNVKMQQTFQKQQAKSELANLRLGRSEILDFLNQFDGLAQGGGQYRDKLLALHKAGKVPLNMTSMMPPPFYGRAQTLLQRIYGLANQLNNWNSQLQNAPIAPGPNADWIGAESSVYDAIQDQKKLLSGIDNEIVEREKQL
jgi:hypothetical protein